MSENEADIFRWSTLDVYKGYLNKMSTVDDGYQLRDHRITVQLEHER